MNLKEPRSEKIHAFRVAKTKTLVIHQESFAEYHAFSGVGCLGYATLPDFWLNLEARHAAQKWKISVRAGGAHLGVPVRFEVEH
jgi:hypothetical protein